ncbi:MAG TPA: IPT/TIG domain-containing protein [Actinomycetota bacterium]|nr:IPT/TIG domain-containing protein [Actinomycetota bacterium]
MQSRPGFRRLAAVSGGTFLLLILGTSAATAQTPTPTPVPSPVESPGSSGIPLAEVDPNTALLLVVLGSIGVALIWLIPMLWDLTRSYRALAEVRTQITGRFLDRAAGQDLTSQELQVLLRELSRPPRGYPGLSRSLMAFVVITIVAVSQLGLSFFNISGAEDLRKTIVNSLLAVFASIAGFYFGTRAATQADRSEAAGTPQAAGGRPVVARVSPPSGPPAGGTVVTITGSGFSAATDVMFGKAPGVDAQAADDTRITVKAPPGTGTVDVTVVAPKGNSVRTLGSRFSYAEVAKDEP